MLPISLNVPTTGLVSLCFARHTRCYSSRPSETVAVPVNAHKPRKKVTIRTLQQLHTSQTPISVVTAYDYPSARFLEQAGIDVCLVGDSLAMVACGYTSTTEIGMDEMLYHCKSVARGAKTPLLVADMPFGSHQPSLEFGIANAVRMIREGGMDAVKIEGGEDVVPIVTKLVDIGIPVMAHIGLMPQRQVGARCQTLRIIDTDTFSVRSLRLSCARQNSRVGTPNDQGSASFTTGWSFLCSLGSCPRLGRKFYYFRPQHSHYW